MQLKGEGKDGLPSDYLPSSSSEANEPIRTHRVLEIQRQEC